MNNCETIFGEEKIRVMAALRQPLGVFTLPEAACILGRSESDIKILLERRLMRRLGGPFCTIHFAGPYITRLAADEQFAAKAELALNNHWDAVNKKRKEQNGTAGGNRNGN